MRRKNWVAFWPTATTSISTPLSCHSRIAGSRRRNRFELRPPHRPRSVDTTTKPTRATFSRCTRNGWLKSVLAWATCAITLRIWRA